MTTTIDLIPWDVDAWRVAPETFPADLADAVVRGVFYEGIPYQGRPTRVFAWLGLPEGDGPWPGMVLVHGGGGTAFAEWVRLWTSRGYAAIAMDLDGCVPVGEYNAWERHDVPGPLGIVQDHHGGIDEGHLPLADQWPFHAVAAVTRGHALLAAQPGVDAARIGITGVSWGGYTTCLAAAVDDGFAFAAPVYGCGFLGENSGWLAQFAEMGSERAARWLSLWDPRHYLPRITAPVLWVNGTNDFAYPMDSWQKSYRLTANRTLANRVRMPHAHGGPGENPPEIHALAEALTRGGAPLATISALPRRGATVSAAFTAPVPATGAELCFTTDAGAWNDKVWDTRPAVIDGDTLTATLPDGTAAYFLNLYDARGCVVSTEHEVRG
jgi:dienelactone hydrolase